jgi:8-oxo-dGTP pyrophosphatase MutT (NUDIX family)
VIHAAGILFTTPDRKALFLLRGHGGDFPLQWCLPGGKLEDGETPEQAAEREADEECGSIPDGIQTYLCRSQAISAGVDPNGVSGEPGQAGAGETVDFTTFHRRINEQFLPQQDDEHIGYCWAPYEQPPQPLHPGVAIALRRIGANELQVARMIAAGELTSPHRFENMLLYAMRMSGTGVAYRQGLDEFVHRDPAIWLSEAMIDRCAGVPLIWEHPQGSVLNSKEFASRVIGTTMFGYVRNDELWCVVRVYDEDAIRMMESEKTSTSPAVVFRDPSVNKHMALDEGEKLLIEGIPSYLDHLAITGINPETGKAVPGVWDKGGELVGIDVADHRADAIDAPSPSRDCDVRLDSALRSLTLANIRMSNIAAARRRS